MTEWLKEYALALPRVALLVPRLLGDDRVSLRTKATLTGFGFYLISPWDLIPDFIPVLGQLDDLTVLLLLFDGVLNHVDDDILLDHWTGDVATLRQLQSVAWITAFWIPARFKRFFFANLNREARRRQEETENRLASRAQKT